MAVSPSVDNASIWLVPSSPSERICSPATSMVSNASPSNGRSLKRRRSVFETQTITLHTFDTTSCKFVKMNIFEGFLLKANPNIMTSLGIMSHHGGSTVTSFRIPTDFSTNTVEMMLEWMVSDHVKEILTDQKHVSTQATDALLQLYRLAQELQVEALQDYVTVKLKEEWKSNPVSHWGELGRHIYIWTESGSRLRTCFIEAMVEFSSSEKLQKEMYMLPVSSRSDLVKMLVDQKFALTARNEQLTTEKEQLVHQKEQLVHQNEAMVSEIKELKSRVGIE